MNTIKIFTYIGFFTFILGCSTNNDSNSGSDGAPLAPTNLSGQVISQTEINLTWTDNATNVTGYKVERKTGSGAFEIIAYIYMNTSNYSDAVNVTANTTYTYRVYCFNENVNSAYSNEFTISTSFPILTTANVTNIGVSSALSGGIISSDGGATVTARGVVWSTTINPTIALPTKTIDGAGTGTFVSNITGLLTNTTYYVRAYATNSTGTSYGENVNFTINAPSITTKQLFIYGGDYWNSFPLYKTGGTITSDGGSPITARGIVWSTSPNPTIALSTKTIDGTGIGTFVSVATGLITNPVTTYYIRAYATNSNGTFYGNEAAIPTMLFYPPNTLGSDVSDIDGNVYHTVSNCSQTWTQSNLNVTHYRNGDVIPQGDYNQISTATTGAWYYYNNDPANGAIYGKLYNYYAINDPRGLAPAGFHVPTEGEWNTFLTCISDYGDYSSSGVGTLGGYNTPCTTCIARLKETGFSHWMTGTISGNNLSGFTALPMKNNGNSCTFWSSTSNCVSTPTPPCTSAISYEISDSYAGHSSNSASSNNLPKKVRCIKD